MLEKLKVSARRLEQESYALYLAYRDRPHSLAGQGLQLLSRSGLLDFYSWLTWFTGI